MEERGKERPHRRVLGGHDAGAGGRRSRSGAHRLNRAGQRRATSRPARPAETAAHGEGARGEGPALPVRAKEAEPKEAPRVAPPAGSINEMLASAAAVTLAAAYMVPEMKGECVAVEVARDDIPAVMTAARDDERLDLKYLRCLSGVDWQDFEGLELSTTCWSMDTKHKLTGEDARHLRRPERAEHRDDLSRRRTGTSARRDMFGINFEGHPNLVPLLLPEDMTDHFPLRKDNPLQEIEEWQGDNLRDGAGEGDE